MHPTFNRFKNRLKNPILLLCAMMLVFSTVILWVFYFAQTRLLDDVMQEQSAVEARLVKRTYEIEQLEMKAKEKSLNEYLLLQSKQAAEEVKKLKRMDEASLKRIIKRFDITGLWVIGEDNKIRAGTTPENGTDTSGFYSEFIDKDFVYQIDRIRRESGDSWVSPFKLSHHIDPKGYMKYAYTSSENPEDASEIIVVETGASIEEIKAKRYGSDRFVTRHTLPENIKNVTINEQFEGPPEQRLKTKRLAGYHYETSLIVDDLAGESLLTVEMDYKELHAEQRSFLYVTLIATLMMGFIFAAAMHVKERQRYSNIIKEEYQKQIQK